MVIFTCPSIAFKFVACLWSVVDLVSCPCLLGDFFDFSDVPFLILILDLVGVLLTAFL